MLGKREALTHIREVTELAVEYFKEASKDGEESPDLELLKNIEKKLAKKSRKFAKKISQQD